MLSLNICVTEHTYEVTLCSGLFLIFEGHSWLLLGSLAVLSSLLNKILSVALLYSQRLSKKGSRECSFRKAWSGKMSKAIYSSTQPWKPQTSGLFIVSLWVKRVKPEILKMPLLLPPRSEDWAAISLCLYSLRLIGVTLEWQQIHLDLENNGLVKFKKKLFSDYGIHTWVS